jgi:hypothetical protein
MCNSFHNIIYTATDLYVCHIWTTTNTILLVKSHENMQKDDFYIATGDSMIVYVCFMTSQRYNYSQCLTWC